MTRYPKAGRGRQWTVRELAAVPPEWKGDTLSDGGGLSGEVRVASDGKVSVRFKFAFRWEDRVCWHQCGTWPTVDLADIRRGRDDARKKVTDGVHPTAAKESARIERQRTIDESLARAEAERRDKLAVDDLFTLWLAEGVHRSDGNKEITRIYSQYILPCIGALELRELTESHIRAMLKPVVAAGTVRKAQLMLLCIKQALRWGEKRRPWRALLLEGNPADLITEDSITPTDHKDERDRVLMCV